MILLCQIKMQIEKRFKSYPTLYREWNVSLICAPIWALLRSYLAMPLFIGASMPLECTENTTAPTLSLEFTHVQRGQRGRMHTRGYVTCYYSIVYIYVLLWIICVINSTFFFPDSSWACFYVFRSFFFLIYLFIYYYSFS
jgi:hypothetical protein